MPLEAPEQVAASPSHEHGWIAVDAPADVGLSGVRAHLERVVARLHLRSLTVVVEDPDLGLQAFRAGSGAVESGVVSAGIGVLVDPAVPDEDLHAHLLVELCAACLRVDVLRDSATGELALRRLPGVFAVEVEHDDELTICRVHVEGDAPDDIGRAAARALSTEPGSRLVIEVVRAASAPAPTSPPPAPLISDRSTADDDAAPPPPASPTERLTLLAVRSVPEDGEIEVHLALGDARAVGRAPLARGLAGAVDAVITGAGHVTAAGRWRPAWARTVETTADGHFVVAVALVDPDAQEHRHGIATGSSPIAAAAGAATDALA